MKCKFIHGVTIYNFALQNYKKKITCTNFFNKISFIAANPCVFQIFLVPLQRFIKPAQI